MSSSTKFGISKVGDWGYVGISFDNLESVYGIPFHGDEHDDEHGDEHDDHGDEHGDEEEHEEHGDERIFSTTDSESTTIKGSYNVNGNLINKVNFTFRNSDYTLTEAHEEEEGHDDVSKAGRAVKSQAPARSGGDNIKSGDKPKAP